MSHFHFSSLSWHFVDKVQKYFAATAFLNFEEFKYSHGATTLAITTLSIMGLFATLSLNDTQHNNTAIMLSVVMLSAVVPINTAQRLVYLKRKACCEN
jgi:uncharacterized membrane protein YjgN (DUF898 family)